MPTTLADAPAPRAGTLPTRRTPALSLPEVRWAVAATVLFAAGLVAQFAGAPVWMYWGLYLACYVTGGWEPAWAGLQALREKTLDVDLLMIVAAIGAAAIGQVLDGGLLIVIFATSGALEAVATRRTEDSVKGLLDLAPAQATRVTATGAEEQVDTADVAIGDIIVIRPGERIGADGRVVDGASDVDQASITGEPLPAAKAVDDEVFAGTHNGSGVLRVRVERDPTETVIARIVSMVEEASATKAKTQLFIEKIEQRYSLGVVVATVALFFIPLAVGSALQPTLLRAMTFMIVASPCAVVLATMPPLLSAIANAGRHGVLVKSAVVMEQLGNATVVAFDKTGTLTEGRPALTDVRVLAAADIDEASALAFAASAEAASEHPLGRTVVAAARERRISLHRVEDFRSTPGVGVSALVDGRQVAITSPTRIDEHSPQLSGVDIDVDIDVDVVVSELERHGRTAVVVSLDATPVAVLGFTDQLRRDADAVVRSLTALTGTTPTMLTGDNTRAATQLATTIGITDVRSELLPQGQGRRRSRTRAKRAPCPARRRRRQRCTSDGCRRNQPRHGPSWIRPRPRHRGRRGPTRRPDHNRGSHRIVATRSKGCCRQSGDRRDVHFRPRCMGPDRHAPPAAGRCGPRRIHHHRRPQRPPVASRKGMDQGHRVIVR